jgi:hypothetical protein
MGFKVYAYGVGLSTINEPACAGVVAVANNKMQL